MKINKKLITYFFIELALCLFLFFFIFQNNVIDKSNIYNMEQILGIFTVINFTVTIIYINKIKKEYFSISTLFVIFLYMFNLGIPISRLFGWINHDTELFLNRRIYSMGYNTFVEYSFYAYLLITFLQIGLMYFYSSKCKGKNYKYKIYDNAKYELGLKQCVYIGKILLVLGIIPYLIQESNQIYYSIKYGYQNPENIFYLSGTGIGLIGGLVYLAIILLLYGYQNNKSKFNIIFAITCLYQIIRMYITGDRSTGISLIFVILLMRHKFISPIKGKKIILYGILAYIMLLFIKLVELTRHIDSLSANEVLSEIIKDNMLAETMSEYGGNVWCGMMIYYSVPSTGSFRFGLTYIAAIIGKPLQVLGITDSIWRFADFSNFLIKPERGRLINTLTSAMGGSFSGEWYFNFGWIGIFIIPLFGYFLGWFSDSCTDKSKNPVLSSFFLYVSTLLIWWIRQYFTSVSWNTLVYGVLLYIIYWIVLKRYKYKKNTVKDL